MNRRQFLTGLCAAAGAALPLTGYTLFHETTEDLEYLEQVVPLPNLPAEFDDYRIGFVTDLHLGVTVSEDLIQQALNKLFIEKMDLLILGGDYIWVPESPLAQALEVVRSPKFVNLNRHQLNEEVFSTLSALCASVRPKDGILAVYGNHDRWTHPTAVSSHFAAVDIELLRNEVKTFRRGKGEIRFVGVDDYLTGIPLIPDLPTSPEPNILVCHNPDYVNFLFRKNEDRIDFAICGHTHGGQINVPFLGPIAVRIRDPELISGLCMSGPFPSYTSRGIGVVEVPYRFDCRPEATMFVLKRALPS
jgi:uncharacterized protein